MDVIPVAEARAGLSRVLASFRSGDTSEPVVLGSHRRPEAVLLPIERYQRLLDVDLSVSLERLRTLRPLIERLAAVSRISEVKVFGSVARGEQVAGSDVDLLIVPMPGATLFDIAQFELDMEAVLGVPVDAVPAGGLDPERDEQMLREAVSL